MYILYNGQTLWHGLNLPYLSYIMNLRGADNLPDDRTEPNGPPRVNFVLNNGQTGSHTFYHGAGDFYYVTVTVSLQVIVRVYQHSLLN